MIGNVGFVQQCSKSLIGMHKDKPSIDERSHKSAAAFSSSHLAASAPPPFFSQPQSLEAPKRRGDSCLATLDSCSSAPNHSLGQAKASQALLSSLAHLRQPLLQAAWLLPPFFSCKPQSLKPQKAGGTHVWQRWIRAAVLQITHWDRQRQAKHC